MYEPDLDDPVERDYFEDDQPSAAEYEDEIDDDEDEDYYADYEDEDDFDFDEDFDEDEDEDEDDTYDDNEDDICPRCDSECVDFRLEPQGAYLDCNNCGATTYLDPYRRD